MRALGTTIQRALEARAQQTHVTVEIEDDGGALVDWSTLYLDGSLIRSVEWSESVDDNFATATVELRYQVRDHNASPYVLDTRWSGHLAVGRRLVIKAAVMPDRYPVAAGLAIYQVTVFDGQIDALDFRDDGTATLNARDRLGAELSDRWVEQDAVYGSEAGTDLEDVLDDLWTASLTPDPAPSLEVPVTPGWALTEYNQQKTSLMQATSALVEQIGWDLRPRWHAASSSFRWTLTEPDRGATAGDETWTFKGRDYRTIPRAGITLEHVRNVIEVWYIDGTTNTGATLKPQAVVELDAASIAAYGRRWMEVTEGSSSNVDSAAEAQDMAQAILADLKDPELDVQVELLLLFWPVEIGDFYALEPDNIRWTTTQYLGVTGYTHRADDQGCRTTLTLSGKPRAGRQRWLDMLAGPGRAPTRDEMVPQPPTIATAQPTIGGVRIKTTVPPGYNWDFVEVHRGTSEGFTVNSSTLVTKLRGTAYLDTDVTIGTPYYYKTRVASMAANESADTVEVSATPRGVERADISSVLTTAIGVTLSADATGLQNGDVLPFDTKRYGTGVLLTGTDAGKLRVDTTAAFRVAWDVRVEDVDNTNSWTLQLRDPSGVLWESPAQLDNAQIQGSYEWAQTTERDIWLQLAMTNGGGTASCTINSSSEFSATAQLYTF